MDIVIYLTILKMDLVSVIRTSSTCKDLHKIILCNHTGIALNSKDTDATTMNRARKVKASFDRASVALEALNPTPLPFNKKVEGRVNVTFVYLSQRE